MAQKKDQHYPVVRTGRINKPSPALNNPLEIRINDFMSMTNRRLYRQARTYQVKIDLDVDSTDEYRVYALADNWMNHRALRMAYAMYLENSAEERERLKGNADARWQDFRTISGAVADRGNPMMAEVDLGAGPTDVQLLNGEFQDTLVVDASGANRSFVWQATGTASRYSILEEYDKAGNAQAAPDTSTGDMPYDDLMSDDSALMAEHLQTKGNLPPYDANGVGASHAWVRVGTLQAGTSQRLSTGFFSAPCGFVIITNANNVNFDASKLSWTVKAGDYKGVHAPSMLDGIHSSGTSGTWKGNVWTKN